ncbi:MAG: hypothetical protein JST66_13985 [Bacteroidetes bacterium]|nr:hypothetical protein [Bacteroidota bacterium]
MFAHFEEYLRQKRSDRPEDKCEVYWTAEYYEKPMDQIRIIAAVENSLKAMMLERGYMVHYIREAEDTRHFAKMQAEGRPVPIDDFLLVRDFMTDVYTHHPVLEGLRNEWKTIEAKHLLMEPLTTLFNMDEQFVHLLKRIQRDRNRVHFMIDYPGAHRVNQYIDEWTFVRDQCRLLTESEKH